MVVKKIRQGVDKIAYSGYDACGDLRKDVSTLMSSVPRSRKSNALAESCFILYLGSGVSFPVFILDVTF